MILNEKCVNREQLFAYAHRLLEARERDAVRAHLAGCAVCRGTVEEYETLDRLLDEWKPMEPSPWFDARVRAAVSATEPEPSSKLLFGFPWARWLVPAFLLLLVVAGAVVILRVRRAAEVSKPVAQQVSPKIARPTPGLVPSQAPLQAGEEELAMYQNLPVLEDEDYDLIANFEVLSELPRGEKNVAN